MDSSGKRRPWPDRIKNLLIILLLCSALLLLSQTDYFRLLWKDSSLLSSVSGLIHGGGGEAPGAAGGSKEDEPVYAAIPMVLAVTTADGFHFGVKYDRESLEECFGRFAADLCEALGTAGEPEEASVLQWQSALTGEGIYFDFINPLPLSVLAGWLGTEMGSSAGLQPVRRLCLAREGDSLSLYYIRDTDGLYYRCATAGSFSSLSASLNSYTPNGAYFAWESQSRPADLDPNFLVLVRMPTLYSLNVKNPFHGSLVIEDLLSDFDMNSFVISPYTEADGTQLYVENDRSLRLYPDGTLSFRQSGGGGLAVEDGLAGALEGAFRLAQASAGASCGEARLFLSDLRYNSATGEYTVCFDYEVDGIPVRCGAQNAVAIVIEKGFITRMTATFRQFSFSSDIETPMPDVQAAAASGATGSGEPLLIYEESGDKAGLGWVLRP